MEQHELLKKVLARLDEITGTTDPAAPESLETAVFQRLDQAGKIIGAIRQYLPKRVIDKILLNPDGVKVEGERRPVTVLFGDLSGFTAMSETMDPEQVVEVVNQYFDTMVEIAERYGGHIDKFMGDALMVLFGAPVVHEDDALRACLAAVEMLEAMDRFSAERKMDLAMSIGLNTGEVVALNVGSKGRMEYTVIGDGVNLAARLEKVATARQCVIGENTYRQVKGKIRLKKLKPVMVKGKSKPQNVYLILGRMESAETAAGLRAHSIPMVGRMAELDAVRSAVASAKDGAGRVVAITGGPGLGKSRLAKELELLARDEGFRFAKGKCYSYASGVAYLPFLRQLQQMLGVQEHDAPGRKKEKLVEKLQALDLSDFEPFLGSLLGIAYPEIGDLDPEKRKRRTFDGFTSLFHKESSRQPLALSYEDLQWADSLTLELLEHLAETVSDKPILVCCDYRPELALPFIARPFCTSLVLEPLDQRAVFQMMAALAGTADVADQVVGKVSERTEGNPLFIEEVTRHLLSRRLVRRDGENLVPAKRFGAMALPGTVAGVVLGRIDKLSEELRHTLQYASVIGKEFDHELLAHITKTPVEQLRPRLDNLEHFEGLLYSKEVEGRRYYQFHSTTTQEAAYGTLLKGRRQELHGAVAQTYEREYKGNLEPWLEDLAHHFYHSKFEDKAVAYLHKAGDKARGLYANQAALNYYGKAIDVLKKVKQSHGHQLEKASLIFKSGGIQRLLGDRANALKSFNASHRLAKKNGDLHAAMIYILESAIIHDKAGDIDQSKKILDQVLASSDKSSVAFGRALTNVGHLALRQGDLEMAKDAFLRAESIFCAHEDKKQIIQITGSLAEIEEKTGKIDEAVNRYQYAIKMSEELKYMEGQARYNNNIGNCFLMSGNLSNAQEAYIKALYLSRQIGDLQIESFASGSIGIVSAITGDYSKAFGYFNDALSLANDIREISQVVNMKINIGCLYQLWGDVAKAIEYHADAVNKATQIKDLGNFMEAKRNIAIDLGLAGAYNDAIAASAACREKAERVGDTRMLTYIKAHDGNVQCLLGQQDQALPLLSQGLNDAKQIGDPEVILAVVRYLTNLHIMRSDWENAARLVQGALHMSDDTHNKREKAYALLHASAMTLAQGSLDEMVGPLTEGTELGREIGDKILLTRLYLLSARKALKTGAHKEAGKYLDDAFELAQKVGSPDLLWQMYYWRGELLKAQGLDQQAGEFFAKAQGAVESMKPQVPEGMWEGFINNTERKLVYDAAMK